MLITGSWFLLLQSISEILKYVIIPVQLFLLYSILLILRPLIQKNDKTDFIFIICAGSFFG